MPQYRKYKSNSQRQAAYRARQVNERRRELADRGLPPLPKISTMPGAVRWTAALERCVALLEMVRDEISEYCEERSEHWHQTGRAEMHKDNVKALERLLNKLEDIWF
jgi:hypothetical protein